METRFWRQARAKINLSLRVVARRQDGYHELDSLMARLDLADMVGLDLAPKPGADRLMAINNLEVPLPSNFSGPDNLALKAVSAYRTRNGWPKGGVSIHLEKHIPIGAGLGGGSADCAAVLNLLNQAAPKPLDADELAGLGLDLGADVPFCLSALPLARAKGVGERLSSPAVASHQQWLGRRLILVNPGFALSTSEVFKKLGLTNGAANNNLGPVSEELRLGDNDLLKPALALAPQLADLAKILAGYGLENWGLSGSGPTFWLYDSDISGDLIARALPDCWVRAVLIS